MRYPKFINKESKIAFIAPSFGCTTEPYKSDLESAIKKLNSLGYNITVGPNCFSQINDLSNEKELVAKEFMDHYKSSDLLMSVGGGETQMTTLPFIDFNKLNKEEPKWHMGFSDNTNYLFLLTTICDVASIYGPCASKFGKDKWDDEENDAFDILLGNKNIVKSYPKYDVKKRTWFKRYKKIEVDTKMIPYPSDTLEFSGRIIGGCMDILKSLCGTKYDKVLEFNEKYKEDGIIWYLENCDGNPVEIKRELFQLKEAGWFKYVKGFIIGRPLSSMNKELFGVNHINACDILKEFNVPVIIDAPIGHIHPSMPIVNGAYCKCSYKDNELILEYNFR